MSDESTTGVHWSFWLIGALCLVWNLLGVMTYMQEVNPDSLAAMPEAYRTMVEMRPGWATGAFAIAVWGGVLGCVLLLLRKAIAFYAFVASLLGVLVQMTYGLVVAESRISYGPSEIIMAIMIPAIALFLIWYSKYAASNKWIS
jgi:hypothetical protein